MNYLVYNQLALDLFSSVTVILTYSFHLININYTGTGGFIICVLIPGETILFVGLNGSMINLAFIAIECYIKIVHALWHKKYFRPQMAYAAMAFVWLTGILGNVIISFLTTTVIDGQCLAVWASQTEQQTYTESGILLPSSQ